jgi:hypothetical protein
MRNSAVLCWWCRHRTHAIAIVIRDESCLPDLDGSKQAL